MKILNNDGLEYYSRKIKEKHYTKQENNNLLNAKQDTIDSSHKISSDLVDDTNSTNKFVTSSEKTTWNAKQDALTAGDNITIENNVISASGENIYYCTHGDTTSEEVITMSQEIIDKAFNNEEMILIVKVNNDKTYISSSYELWNTPSSRFVRFAFSDSGYDVMSGSQTVSMPLTGFTVAITFDENRNFVRINYNSVASYNLARRYDGNNSYGALGAKNTTAYTPTGDYNPATKKYVDDSISNKIWAGTQAEYDALEEYSDTTLYFIKEATEESGE